VPIEATDSNAMAELDRIAAWHITIEEENYIP